MSDVGFEDVGNIDEKPKPYSTSTEQNGVEKPPVNVHFKILIPSVAAGAIIGKSGEAITILQNETATKVKMSKANAFYPGTTERVCLVIGLAPNVLRVFEYISEKVYQKPEFVSKSIFNEKPSFDCNKQVKILVPNSTAGMIIGKGGGFIKHLKSSLGIFIQVSQKSKELNLAERCVTIAGDLKQTREAVALILNKIQEDPQSSSCPNISYSEFNGPIASAYPTGSPYALSNYYYYNLNYGSDDYMKSGGGVGCGCTTLPTSSSNSTLSPRYHHHQLSAERSYGSSIPFLNSNLSSTRQPSIATAAIAAALGGAVNLAMTPSTSSITTSSLSSPASSFNSVLNGRRFPSHHFSILGSVDGGLHANINSNGNNNNNNNDRINGSSHILDLDYLHTIVQLAGYNHVASEEIVNAIQVLNRYGLISLSSMKVCKYNLNTIEPCPDSSIELSSDYSLNHLNPSRTKNHHHHFPTYSNDSSSSHADMISDTLGQLNRYLSTSVAHSLLSYTHQYTSDNSHFDEGSFNFKTNRSSNFDEAKLPAETSQFTTCIGIGEDGLTKKEEDSYHQPASLTCMASTIHEQRSTIAFSTLPDTKAESVSDTSMSSSSK